MDLSIIIPTYNRKLKLKSCLDSLFAQTYPLDSFEIIVIDDGSTDGTIDMLVAFAKTNHNFKYFIQAHKGPAAARNLGIKQAQAEIIGFTDSDCLVDKDWVGKMVQAHRLQVDVAGIGGATVVDLRNIKAKVSQSLSDGAIEIKISGKPEIIFFPTCNVSFKREYIVSGFNELFPLPAGEDLDFFWRLFKKGGKSSYNKEIMVFHDCHADLISFLRQAYMYGRGNYLVQYKHKDHPLLKEIKTKNNIVFISGLIINIVKIPRFSYLSGKRLIQQDARFNFHEKIKIYFYFGLHKIMYLVGNVVEHAQIQKTIKTKVKETAANVEKNLSKPEFIILDITHKCNLKCNVCEIRKNVPMEEFTTDEVKGLIAQAIEWGVKEFVLSGGEPFVREDIFDILEFVREKKYHVGILTNGILLSDDFIKSLLPYLISNTLSLSISLDALTPAIHDDIRGDKGCFTRTFNGLKILSEFKKKYPSINFNVISIILNQNLEELIPLANLLKSFNLNSIQFQPLLANNLIMKERSSGAKYWIRQERLPALDKVIDALVEFKRQNPQLVRNSENNLRLVKKYFQGLLTNNQVKCLYAVKTMLIANNGDVTTCFDCYGNIRKAPLKGIFLSYLAACAREKVKECKHPCLLPCFTDN